MNTNKIAIVLVIIILFAGGLFIIANNKSENGSVEGSSANNDKNQPISAETVSEHNSKENCWTIIDGSVYNITSYIPRHEGGDNILSACGVDATEFFDGNKAGMLGDSKKHGGSAKSALSSLKVGVLTQ